MKPTLHESLAKTKDSGTFFAKMSMKINENEDCAHKGTKCDDFEEKTTKVRHGVAPKFIFMIYLMYWI